MSHAMPASLASSNDDLITAAPLPIDLELDVEAPVRPVSSDPAAASHRSGHAVAGLVTESIVLLDPRCIDPPAAPGRLPESFDTEEFQDLCLAIAAAGGNLLPLKVRQTATDPPRYRLIHGERRMRACSLAGLPVRAIIAPPGTESEDCLDQMRENLGRRDLSPYEFGQQVRHAMETLQPITRTALATRLGTSLSRVSRALDIATLPGLVISAFQSPGEIRNQDIKPLKDAWREDHEAVGLEVANLREMPERAAGPEVVKRIVQAVAAQRDADLAPCKPPEEDELPRPIHCRGQKIGQYQRLANRALVIELTMPMSKLQDESTVAVVVQHIERRVIKPSVPMRASSSIGSLPRATTCGLT